MPSVPVIPTTARSLARVAVPPGGGRRQGAPASRSTTSCGRADVGQRRARRGRRAAPAPRPRCDEVVAVDVQPGDGDEQRPGPDRARVVGDAADRDVGQPGGADRPAIASRAAQAALRGRAARSGAPRGAGSVGSAAREEVVDRRLGHRRSQPRETARQPADARSRAGRRPARGRRSARASGRRTSVLCWYRPYSGSPSRGSPRAPADVDAAQVHLACSPRGSPAGSPASGAGGARPGASVRVVGVVARVDGRQPAAVAVEDRARPAARRRHRAVPRLEVDEVAGREGRAPPADEAGARPEREVAPLAGLEQQVVEPVERRGRRLGSGATKPSPGPVAAGRGVVADDRDLAVPRPGSAAGWTWRSPRRPPPRRRRRRAAARPGGATAGSPRSGRNPAASIVARNAALRGGHLGVGRHDVDPLPGQRLADGDLALAERRRGPRPIGTGPRGR